MGLLLLLLLLLTHYGFRIGGRVEMALNLGDGLELLLHTNSAVLHTNLSTEQHTCEGGLLLLFVLLLTQQQGGGAAWAGGGGYILDVLLPHLCTGASNRRQGGELGVEARRQAGYRGIHARGGGGGRVLHCGSLGPLA